METINLASVRLPGFSPHIALMPRVFCAANAEQMLNNQGEPRGYIIMDWFTADFADLMQLRCFMDYINLCICCCKRIIIIQLPTHF